MDQIFERLERLIKSWVTMDQESPADYPGSAAADRGRQSRRTGDSDYDAAMSELDDFLKVDRTATEEKERRAESERRRREEAERSRASRGGSGQGGPSPAEETRRAVAEAYQTLGLAYNAPFPEVKTAYKKLLKINHPDLNSQTPERLRHATAISARINAAYQLIETWVETKGPPRT